MRCGNCRICRMLEKQQHPDVRWVEHSGKLGGFSVETVRSVCTDLAIPPSEGDAKFYVFADCDAMDPRTQNLLLKAVEEPPDYVYFLFTAESPAVLLPTVRSRIVSEAVFPVTERNAVRRWANGAFHRRRARTQSAYSTATSGAASPIWKRMPCGKLLH